MNIWRTLNFQKVRGLLWVEICMVRKGTFNLGISEKWRCPRRDSLHPADGPRPSHFELWKQIHPRNRDRGLRRFKSHFWYQFCINLGPSRQEKTHSNLNRGKLDLSNAFEDRSEVLFLRHSVYGMNFPTNPFLFLCKIRKMVLLGLFKIILSENVIRWLQNRSEINNTYVNYGAGDEY